MKKEKYEKYKHKEKYKRGMNVSSCEENINIKKGLHISCFKEKRNI